MNGVPQKKWLTGKCLKCGKPVDHDDALLINEESDLIFCSEECLYHHFSPQIETLEKEFETNHPDTDIPRGEFSDYEECLEQLLEGPDEVWEDTEIFPGIPLHQYIGEFLVDGETVYYVAVVYMSGETPSFVFLHFPTKVLKLVEGYRRGRLVYSKEQDEGGAITGEGDALGEGDELATNLHRAMLNLRSPKDIPEQEFETYARLRDETVEEADEIWKSNDLQGNTLLTFIRDCSSDENGLFYLVVTVEDIVASSHYVLFSFPTKDANLVERYRNGERVDTDSPPKTSNH